VYDGVAKGQGEKSKEIDKAQTDKAWVLNLVLTKYDDEDYSF
jgi:hypothetical protein